jgi:hypothetical protein
MLLPDPKPTIGQFGRCRLPQKGRILWSGERPYTCSRPLFFDAIPQDEEKDWIQGRHDHVSWRQAECVSLHGVVGSHHNEQTKPHVVGRVGVRKQKEKRLYPTPIPA